MAYSLYYGANVFPWFLYVFSSSLPTVDDSKHALISWKLIWRSVKTRQYLAPLGCSTTKVRLRDLMNGPEGELTSVEAKSSTRSLETTAKSAGCVTF